MNLFKTKFDAATIVLIPACIGINYLGKMFASLLKLPLCWIPSAPASAAAWAAPSSAASAARPTT